MREIKFRAWDTIDSEWKYSGHPHMPVWKFWESVELGGGYENVCQYTGLKDKNGVEIYEGDIIDGEKKMDSFPSRYGVVRWVDAGFRFSWLLTWKDGKGVPPYEDPMYWNALGENTKYLKVIGNIYESNLLKGVRG